MIYRIEYEGGKCCKIAFFSMFGAAGTAIWAIESDGSYWRTIAFMVLLIACTYLSIKEERKRK